MALFEIDTPDVVQAQSDLINATVAVAKSKTQINLFTKAYERQRDLYKAKAVSQKDFEQAQSDLRQAESDLKANEGLLIAARNKLRILGRSDQEVARVEVDRQINPIMVVRSPIAGTITTRKVGPGQYVRTDNTDPLFSISDLSSMWVRANVSEADIPKVQIGQELEVRVMAYPTEVFRAKVTSIAPSVDPNTHRVAVRSEIANAKRLLKPEMFASFKIVTGESDPAPSVPVGAVIREADAAHVWVMSGPRQFQRRVVKLGLEQDGHFQAASGIAAGETIVVEGAVYLSNARSGAAD
jgi:membrane fusion protein, heavy metal efflux system